MTWRLAPRRRAASRLDAEAARADLVFWDPLLAPGQPGPLDGRAPSARCRARCAPRRAALHLPTATATRSALLLAGFHVGRGRPHRPQGGDHRRGPAAGRSRPDRSTTAGWRAWAAPRPPSRPTRRSMPWPGSAPCRSSARPARPIAAARPGRGEERPGFSAGHPALVLEGHANRTCPGPAPAVPHPLGLRRARQGRRPRRRPRRLEGRLHRVPPGGGRRAERSGAEAEVRSGPRRGARRRHAPRPGGAWPGATGPAP